MENLFEKLEEHCMEHLMEIETCAEKHRGFVSSQQIDDMKDLLQSVRDMHKILAMAKKTVV